jgi:hypothetical protein
MSKFSSAAYSLMLIPQIIVFCSVHYDKKQAYCGEVLFLKYVLFVLITVISNI